MAKDTEMTNAPSEDKSKAPEPTKEDAEMTDATKKDDAKKDDAKKDDAKEDCGCAACRV